MRVGTSVRPRSADPRRQPLDLAAVRQQPAVALGLVVLPRRRGVGGDVHAVQPQLPLADRDVPLFQLRPRLAQRLDLGAPQLDPALQALQQLVAVGGVAVARHIPRAHLALAASRLGHRLPSLVARAIPARGPRARCRRPSVDARSARGGLLRSRRSRSDPGRPRVHAPHPHCDRSPRRQRRAPSAPPRRTVPCSLSSHHSRPATAPPRAPPSAARRLTGSSPSKR